MYTEGAMTVATLGGVGGVGVGSLAACFISVAGGGGVELMSIIIRTPGDECSLLGDESAVEGLGERNIITEMMVVGDAVHSYLLAVVHRCSPSEQGSKVTQAAEEAE